MLEPSPRAPEDWTVCLEPPHSYSSAPCLGLLRQTYGPGEPVLRFAAAEILRNEELVRYLVWANPENVQYMKRPEAQFTIHENVSVFDAAVHSPFYAADARRVLSSAGCILKHFECLAANTHHVMQALERSGSELQFAAAALRADPYLVAWAGAPAGASECRTLPAELVLFMKAAAPSALSVAFVEANSQMVFDAYQKYVQSSVFAGNRTPDMREQWMHFRDEQKISWCASVYQSLVRKCPLFYRVAPEVRNILWPTPL